MHIAKVAVPLLIAVDHQIADSGNKNYIAIFSKIQRYIYNQYQII